MLNNEKHYIIKNSTKLIISTNVALFVFPFPKKILYENNDWSYITWCFINEILDQNTSYKRQYELYHLIIY